MYAVQNFPIPPSLKQNSEKDGPKSKSVFKGIFTFPPEYSGIHPLFILSYRTAAHADRKQSPLALIGRQIRVPITMSFAEEEKVWHKRNKKVEQEKEKFNQQKGQNTAVLEKSAANISLC